MYCNNRINSTKIYVTTFIRRDYDEIPRDLLLLGFIPDIKAGLIKYSVIVEVLADIYGACTEGGVAADIYVDKFITQLRYITATSSESSPTF